VPANGKLVPTIRIEVPLLGIIMDYREFTSSAMGRKVVINGVMELE
jgi:hypothetical protein